MLVGRSGRAARTLCRVRDAVVAGSSGAPDNPLPAALGEGPARSRRTRVRFPPPPPTCRPRVRTTTPPLVEGDIGLRPDNQREQASSNPSRSPTTALGDIDIRPRGRRTRRAAPPPRSAPRGHGGRDVVSGLLGRVRGMFRVAADNDIVIGYRDDRGRSSSIRHSRYGPTTSIRPTPRHSWLPFAS